MADSLFHPHPQTLFWSQEFVHDGELGSLEEMESGMGPLLRWKRVAAVDKLAPCNLSRYLHAARSPDPHSTFSTCRPTNPPGWLISRRGHLFFLVALCNNPLSLFAPLSQFHPTGSGDLLETTPSPSPSPSPPFLSPPLLQTTTTWISSSLLILLHTYFVPADHLPRSLVPSHLGHPVCRLVFFIRASLFPNACHKVGLPRAIASSSPSRLQRLRSRSLK